MNIFQKIKVVNKLVKIVELVKKKGLQDKILNLVGQAKELSPEIKTTIDEIIEICK